MKVHLITTHSGLNLQASVNEALARIESAGGAVLDVSFSAFAEPYTDEDGRVESVTHFCALIRYREQSA